jgi:hypothetical protein
MNNELERALNGRVVAKFDVLSIPAFDLQPASLSGRISLFIVPAF